MNKEKEQLQKWLGKIDSHIEKKLNDIEKINIREIDNLFSLRKVILQHLSDIIKQEKERRMWIEFEKEDNGYKYRL
ncbi:hypothetical protein ACKGJO_10470 [Gracilimonas sp. Q87]|uniref:hypothetical protein n=1 Tax=Gracilimonas sp. Q87 TaxID=3384766 RepID=UPI003984402E